MTLDDESILTAYLDGELDAIERQAVDTALRASPRLREQLAELSATRDLLHALPPRPLPRDLAPAVLAALPARRTPAAIRRRRWIQTTAVVLSAAAALLVALLPLFRSQPAPRPATTGPESAIATPSAAEPDQPLPAPPSVAVLPAQPDAPTPTPSHNGPTPDPNRNLVRGWLSRGDALLLPITLDGLTGPTLAEIEAALERTGAGRHAVRFDPQVGLDPDRPDPVAAYLILLDDKELSGLQNDLRQLFVDRVGAPYPVPPTLAARLETAPDRVPLAVASRLLPPPPETAPAFAHRFPGEGPAEPRQPPPDAKTTRNPTAPPPATQPRACLIWITSRPGSGPPPRP